MTYLLDDFATPELSRFGTAWFLFTDQVLDGGSTGSMQIGPLAAQDTDSNTSDDTRSRLSLSGEVNSDKGFIQAALPLVHSRYLFDARHFSGVHLVCRSPGQPADGGYYLHLRTRELSMPWQHYCAPIQPGSDWSEQRIPFTSFQPTSTTHELNLELLSRIAIVAGQRVFSAELQVAEIGFY